MKIAILGNAGSGKSTLARRLAGRYTLAHLDLDTIAFEPDQVAVPRPRDEAEADLARWCGQHGRWVVEGCYAGLIEVGLRLAPSLLFLDPGVEACLANCRARPWEPHKYASKAEQDEKLAFLLDWVRAYDSRDGELSRAGHEATFDAYDGVKQRLTALPGPGFEPPSAVG